MIEYQKKKSFGKGTCSLIEVMKQNNNKKAKNKSKDKKFHDTVCS